MALLRTFLIVLAVMFAPAANVAHADVVDGGPHVVHDAAMPAMTSAADLTDCCEADNLRTSVSCDAGSALIGESARGERSSFGENVFEICMAIPSGQDPMITLDPPRS